jgi:hypothetical protein
MKFKFIFSNSKYHQINSIKLCWHHYDNNTTLEKKHLLAGPSHEDN